MKSGVHTVRLWEHNITEMNKNQCNLKCIILRHIYWIATSQITAVIPKLIKTIKENENMTVSYSNKLSFYKWNNASFCNCTYKQRSTENKYAQKFKINYSRRNWLSIGDLNKSAERYCVRIMFYQITFKKWNKSNLTGIHPIQDSRHTHHNLQLGMQKNVNLLKPLERN